MAKDDEHSGLDEIANFFDPFHVDDFTYGNNDGYTTFEESVTADYFESEKKKAEYNEDHSMDYDDYDDIDNDEDEYDDEIDDFSEDEDNSDMQSGISFSVSFAPEKRTVPNDGFWKYYDEGLDYWDLKLALLDHFPELRKNYDEESDCFADDIIAEVYGYAPEDAIKYLRWLWDYFPAEEINAVSKEGSSHTRKDIITELINNLEQDDEYIYGLLQEEAFIKAYFIDSKWEKHDIYQILKYLHVFINHDDYKNVVKFYELALKTHGEYFTNRDLSQFWKSFIIEVFYDKDGTPYIRKYAKKEITRLLPESKRTLKEYERTVENK